MIGCTYNSLLQRVRTVSASWKVESTIVNATWSRWTILITRYIYRGTHFATLCYNYLSKLSLHVHLNDMKLVILIVSPSGSHHIFSTNSANFGERNLSNFIKDYVTNILLFEPNYEIISYLTVSWHTFRSWGAGLEPWMLDRLESSNKTHRLIFGSTHN